jgi:uncharacterized protein
MPNFQRLPLFPLNTVLFPGLTIPLRIFEPKYLLLLQWCVENRSPFGIVMIRSGSELGDSATELATIGTTARITKCESAVDDSYLIEVVGETRFTIEEMFDSQPYLSARVTPFWEQSAEPLDLQPLYDQTVSLFKGYLASRLSAENRHLANLQMPSDPVLMSFAVAASLQSSLPEKQTLLEIAATSERLMHEIEILQRGFADLDLYSSIENDVNIQTFVPLETADVLQNFSRN